MCPVSNRAWSGSHEQGPSWMVDIVVHLSGGMEEKTFYIEYVHIIEQTKKNSIVMNPEWC